LKETLPGKSGDYWKVLVLEKHLFQKIFRLQENEKPTFPNSSGLRSVLEKYRFCDRLVWTESLTVEVKLHTFLPPINVV